MLTADESAYVIRNNRKFNFEFCTGEDTTQEPASAQSKRSEEQEQTGMTGQSM